MEENGNEVYGFGALFDFSFSRFAVVELVRVLYVVTIILALIGVIIGVVVAFTNGFWAGLFGIIMAPVVFIVWTFFARVWLELIVVVFRIADYTRETAENTRK
jgi:hypothetical protein